MFFRVPFFLNEELGVSDLVSKQDVFNTLKKVGLCSMSAYLFEKIWASIEALPSAETERKKGTWVGDCCSCCGVSKYNYIKMVDDECGPFGTWNFCPNCGADMRGDNDEEA